MDNKKVLNMEDVVREKLTYDELVNVREDVSEIKLKKSSVQVFRFVALSVTILAIVFGSLVLFRIV